MTTEERGVVPAMVGEGREVGAKAATRDYSSRQRTGICRACLLPFSCWYIRFSCTDFDTDAMFFVPSCLLVIWFSGVTTYAWKEKLPSYGNSIIFFVI